MTPLPPCLIPPSRPSCLTLIKARALQPGDIIVYGGTLFELTDTQQLGLDVLFVGYVDDTVSVVVPAGHVFHRMGQVIRPVWVSC